MQGCAAPLSSSSLPLANPKTTPLRRRHPGRVSACRTPGSNHLPITEFNLYQLLGVDASSEKRQIKEAYRALQKRCHPDIAGPAGHDMAIVLNEAYALLCDPVSRTAYDKELAKVGDFQGYTGRPIYSVWKGSEMEQRGVFVDEVKCIGCLKCALLADKTFAVESVYGRARVVAQWADPEYKIQEAIAACPVDCISIVERSELGALEFIMSKLARGRVRVGVGNSADVFDEVHKFKSRYAQHKHSSTNQEASRISAVEAIQMISNWMYWQSSSSTTTVATSPAPAPGRTRPDLDRLKAAAAARKQTTTTTSLPSNSTAEYWVPMTPPPDYCSQSPAPASTPTRKRNRPKSAESLRPREAPSNPLRRGVPMATSLVAALVVGLQGGGGGGGGAVQGHIGGSMALAIVNSEWTQLGLAGLTWYLIAMYVVEFVVGFTRK